MVKNITELVKTKPNKEYIEKYEDLVKLNKVLDNAHAKLDIMIKQKNNHNINNSEQ